MPRQKLVEELVSLLESNPGLKDALQRALQEARQEELSTPDQFLAYLDAILTHVPDEKELMPSVRKFYYVLGKSAELRNDKTFNNWINEFVRQRGSFMDCTESAKTLPSFINNPKYKIQDYIEGPSGWLTYNQFLARQLKPGKRPVADRFNDDIIVSPADSQFRGYWAITEGSMITVKGSTYKVDSLLGYSKYRDEFRKGIFTHSFLDITDYHRFHTPVSGTVREVKKTPGNTWVNEEKKEDGSIENIDDVGFQFEHTRGHIILESKRGLVAVMPVGMGHISSVNLTVEEDTYLVKGEEFGYFAFGGSDIIMLFQNPSVEFLAQPNVNYLMGQAIAKIA